MIDTAWYHRVCAVTNEQIKQLHCVHHTVLDM